MNATGKSQSGMIESSGRTRIQEDVGSSQWSSLRFPCCPFCVLRDRKVDLKRLPSPKNELRQRRLDPSPRDEALRMVARDVLRRQPHASAQQVLDAWRVRTGRSPTAEESSSLRDAYEAERNLPYDVANPEVISVPHAASLWRGRVWRLLAILVVSGLLVLGVELIWPLAEFTGLLNWRTTACGNPPCIDATTILPAVLLGIRFAIIAIAAILIARLLFGPGVLASNDPQALRDAGSAYFFEDSWPGVGGGPSN